MSEQMRHTGGSTSPLTPPESAKPDAEERVVKALKARAASQRRREGKATSFRSAIGSHGPS
ncbi:MAG: hypothetical protein ACT4NY_00575 [Pseudonocardiales bacterium]